MSERLGPRWLAWITLLYGILEIPWVIALIFFQQRTGTAYHSHLIAIGLSGVSAVIAVLLAVGLWRGWAQVPVLAVMSATLLGTGLGLGFLLSELHVMLAGVVGIVVAILAARQALRHGTFTSTPLAAIMALVAGFSLFHLWSTVSSTPPSFPADHLRALVVLFDTAETVALIGLGWALLKGRARPAIVFGSMGVVLFLIDAWVNILGVPPGQEFVAALFYAVVGELPATAMSAAGLILGLRRWRESEPVAPAVSTA